jgi:hypothetical protein
VTRVRHVVLYAAVCMVIAITPAIAQTPTAGTWEFTAGAVYVGGYGTDSLNAQLTPNSGTAGSVTLFETDTRVTPAVGLLAKVGIFLTPAFSIEGGMRYTQPKYEADISDDFEEAEDLIAEETVNQYLFDVTAVWHFRGTGAGRTMPFIYGGAGYLRELHEGNALVEDGIEVHAGGGVKWWFGSGARWGFRAQGGFSVRDSEFDPEQKRRVVPEASGSLIWVF